MYAYVAYLISNMYEKVANKLNQLFRNNWVMRYLLIITSVTVAGFLFFGAFFSLAFAGCYGDGGFSSGNFSSEGIYSAAFLIAFSGPFIVFPFKRSVKVLVISLVASGVLGIVIGFVSYLLIAP